MKPLPPEPTLLDLLHICLRLRDDERRQYEVLRECDYHPDEAAALFAVKSGPKFVLRDAQGVPYCAGGYEFVGPGVMQSWMIGTDAAWETHSLTITRAARRVIDTLFEHTACYRVQTNCLASREQAMAWYGALGLKLEQVLDGFASNGEALACFARMKP